MRPTQRCILSLDQEIRRLLCQYAQAPSGLRKNGQSGLKDREWQLEGDNNEANEKRERLCKVKQEWDKNTSAFDAEDFATTSERKEKRLFGCSLAFFLILSV
jgi:hypothetical protein